MRDASLDEFLADTDEDEAPGSGADDAEAEGADPGPAPGPEPAPEAGPPADAEGATDGDDPASEPEGPPPAAEVEPARSTFARSPDGATCAACDEQVEERWASDAGLVCPECKEW